MVQGQWIRGIIDEMELDERGRIRVAEHKTRKPPTLPRAAQQRSANLQVCACAQQTHLFNAHDLAKQHASIEAC